MLTRTFATAATLAFIFFVPGLSQTPASKFPPEVLDRKASVVGVKTVPEGRTIKVDGAPVPKNPFILLKKDKPRVLRFELAGYKAVEKTIEPGQHYVIGVGVDFANHKVQTVEFDQPPGSPSGRSCSGTFRERAGNCSAQQGRSFHTAASG